MRNHVRTPTARNQQDSKKEGEEGEEDVGRRWTKRENEVSDGCEMRSVCDVMEFSVMIRFVN